MNSLSEGHVIEAREKRKIEEEQEEINEPNEDSPGKRIGAERMEIQRRGSSNCIFSFCISLPTDTPFFP